MPFEEAIRLYLESFRLPGEAQKIYRIMDSWASTILRRAPAASLMRTRCMCSPSPSLS